MTEFELDDFAGALLPHLRKKLPHVDWRQGFEMFGGERIIRGYADGLHWEVLVQRLYHKTPYLTLNAVFGHHHRQGFGVSLALSGGMGPATAIGKLIEDFEEKLNSEYLIHTGVMVKMARIQTVFRRHSGRSQ